MRPARAPALAGLALLLTAAAAQEPTPDPGLADRPAAVPVEVGDPERGRAAVRRLGCGVCHRIPGLPGAIGIVGPSLDGFAERPLIAGSLPNEGGLLLRFIANPPALVPGTAMPAIDMDEREVRDIAAFLATLD